jgi:hypothetical protein
MSVETLPDYLAISEAERGESLGIDFATYRVLARTALKTIADREAMMGIYRLAESKGCALDFWFVGAENCLTIVVNAAENQLCLLSSPMDGGQVVGLLTVDNSEKGWRMLSRIAKNEIK